MRSAKLFLAGLLLCTAAAHAGDAAAWFERMRDALHGENYEGRFVYQVGPQLDAMYVVHRVSGQTELERLVSLNGDRKQVIRGHRAVACLEPGRHRMSVIEGDLEPGRETELAQLQESYLFTLDEGQRIAGRQARLIRVEPRDKLRFGYEIYVDEETALPLRTVMLDVQGNQQSQMMFVELKTGEDVTPIEHDVSALQMTEKDRITVAAGLTHSHPPGWRFQSLPPGFALRSTRGDEQRRHFILSDGLASLSLYIEPGSTEGLEGYSHVGATRAYGTRRYGRQITAVGEVPEETLRLIVDAIEPQ
jgi:sigma-E factor negative regulatory protein RseB